MLRQFCPWEIRDAREEEGLGLLLVWCLQIKREFGCYLQMATVVFCSEVPWPDMSLATFVRCREEAELQRPVWRGAIKGRRLVKRRARI